MRSKYCVEPLEGYYLLIVNNEEVILVTLSGCKLRSPEDVDQDSMRQYRVVNVTPY